MVELRNVGPEFACLLTFGRVCSDQKDKVTDDGDPDSDSLSVAREIAVPHSEKDLKEKTDGVQRKAEEDERQCKFSYEMVGNSVEDVSLTLMWQFEVMVEGAGVGAVVDNVVESQGDGSEGQETAQTCGYPREVIAEVEEHVYSFHGVR